MKHILLINSEKTLKKYWVTGRYKRIYFGNEFCQQLIPTTVQISSIFSFCEKQKIPFSLLTPYVTEDGLDKLKDIFDFLYKKNIYCEVIINDWGVLRVLNNNYENLSPVLGRLLIKIKREPRLKKIETFLSKKAWEQFQYVEPVSLSFTKLLKKNRISRVELDNVYQGIKISGNENYISFSLYYPYIYLNTTRYCITSTCEQPNSMIGIFSCNRECQKYTFLLKNKGMVNEIYLKGNTQFLCNHELIVSPENIGVDRLVYQPEIPV